MSEPIEFELCICPLWGPEELVEFRKFYFHLRELTRNVGEISQKVNIFKPSDLKTGVSSKDLREGYVFIEESLIPLPIWVMARYNNL